MALWVLVCKETYARPGEMAKFRVEDLNPPAGGAQAGLQLWTLTVAPAARAEQSKTGTTDDTIIIDRPAWLGPELGRLRVNRRNEDPLFDFTNAQALAWWAEACADLRLVADRYQLRHAGASADALSGARSLQEVAARGRWGSLQSVRRYAKRGAVQKTVSRVPLEVRQFGQHITANLEAAIKGQLAIVLPVLAHNQRVVNVVR